MAPETEYPVNPHAPGFAVHRDEILTALREGCPVAHSDDHGGFWLLTRYADVRRALMDAETFSSAHPGKVAIPPSTHTRDFPMVPIEVDPPRHTALRAVLAGRFQRPQVEQFEPQVRQAADAIIDRFVADGSVEIVSQYALPLVSHALAAFLSLPAEDAELWVQWADDIFPDRVRYPEKGREAMAHLVAYVEEVLTSRRRQPRDDLFSDIAGARVDGVPISQEEAVGYGVEVLLAGRDATVDGVGNSLWYLARHPDQQEQLRRQPELTARAVEELLRFMSPIEMLGRVTTRDVTIEGQAVPAGDVVGLSYGSANRDAGFFDEPSQCRFDRRRNRHLAFGSGAHICLGAHLARLDLRVAIDRAITRLGPFSVHQQDAPVLKHNGDTRGFRRLVLDFEGA